jgi:hypothetical protein
MKSLIGHNQPPKDRKADWKSISVKKVVWNELEEIAQRICDQQNCFLLLEGKAPVEKVSIPYAIELLANERSAMDRRFDTQDNGRNIWEQTAKKLLRTYNSKKGLGIKHAK